MTPRFSVSDEDAQGPYVIGLDVGSGGSRAAVYDATGREVGSRKHKEEHAFTVKPDGTSVVDADQIVREILTALEHVLAEPLPGPIVAIGVDTFASSMVAVDAAGCAISPCITYADTRCQAQVKQLSDVLDQEDLHQRTGARLHSSYLTPRLRWLRETEPEVFAATAHFMALGEYLAFALLGTPALGTATAAWSGMLDRRTGDYVPELLDCTGVHAEQMGVPRDPDQALPVAGTKLAKRFPQLADAVWVPVVGDGLTANLGIGAVGEGVWGISTATSGAIRQLLTSDIDHLPTGLWAYRVDRSRTLVGSAMSDCGRVLDWVRSTIALPPQLDGEDVAAVLRGDPSTTTPLMVPFLSGERGTKWRGGARAVIAKVSAATEPLDLLRGALEGVALSYLRIADQLREVGGEPRRVMLSGGATEQVPAWLQLLADALQQPIEHVAISRSTMRGSAVLALERAGVQLQADHVPIQGCIEPIAGRGEYYRQRLEEFEALADLA